MGFYCFTQPIPEVALTMKQKVAALSPAQKNGVIDCFAKDTPIGIVQHRFTVPVEIVDYLYRTINEIQVKAKALMRREVVVTPAILGPLDQVITPAVMNVKPATQADLETLLRNKFSSDLGAAVMTKIFTAMYEYSKYDGKGDYAFYASQIIL